MPPTLISSPKILSRRRTQTKEVSEPPLTCVDFLPEDLKSEENKKYDWTQVYTFVFENKHLTTPFNPVIQNMDDLDSITDDTVQLDSRNIDTDLLQLEGEEANKLYIDLKARAIRRHQKEKRDQSMRDALKQPVEDEEDEDPGFDDPVQRQERPSFSVDQVKNN